MGTAVLPEINPALHGAPLSELLAEPRGRQTGERRQDACRPGALAPHLRKPAWRQGDSARVRPDDAAGSGPSPNPGPPFTSVVTVREASVPITLIVPVELARKKTRPSGATATAVGQ